MTCCWNNVMRMSDENYDFNGCEYPLTDSGQPCTLTKEWTIMNIEFTYMSVRWWRCHRWREEVATFKAGSYPYRRDHPHLFSPEFLPSSNLLKNWGRARDGVSDKVREVGLWHASLQFLTWVVTWTKAADWSTHIRAKNRVLPWYSGLGGFFCFYETFCLISAPIGKWKRFCPIQCSSVPILRRWKWRVSRNFGQRLEAGK